MPPTAHSIPKLTPFRNGQSRRRDATSAADTLRLPPPLPPTLPNHTAPAAPLPLGPPLYPPQNHGNIFPGHPWPHNRPFPSQAELAVWRDPKAQKWVALADACPHRSAPLSEGRLDPTTGTLQCAYHGWRFDGTGACAAIPQIEDAPTAWPRACAARFPTTEAHGLVWVWMETGPGADQRAAAAPLPLPAELRGGSAATASGVLLGDWMMRDLPISWEYLAENLLDPSHVHYAHHGVIGRRGGDRGLRVRIVDGDAATAGHPLAISMEMDGNAFNRGPRRARTHFLPPTLAWLQFPVPGGGGTATASMLFYAVPVSPGRCRFLGGYSTDALPAPLAAALRSRLARRLGAAVQWAADLGAHEVLDGDTVVLRYQEELIAAHSSSDADAWKRRYFLPAPADAGVAAFRRWVGREGGGGPAYGPHADTALVGCPPPPAHLDRAVALDRWAQHTRYCPSCRAALGAVRATRGALGVGTSAAFAGGFALAALEAAGVATGVAGRDPARTAAALGLLGVGLGCGAVSALLGRLERRFVFTDYVHSKK